MEEWGEGRAGRVWGREEEAGRRVVGHRKAGPGSFKGDRRREGRTNFRVGRHRSSKSGEDGGLKIEDGQSGIMNSPCRETGAPQSNPARLLATRGLV